MSIPLQERHLSAVSLKLYQLCPLRFKLRYIDGLHLAGPMAGDEGEQKALERGDQFHLMANRYYAGLDPARLGDPADQQELDHWLGRLQTFLPLTFDRSFYPELELRLNRPDLRLMAKFDLLVVGPDGRATLYDWKTHRRMPGRRFLQNAWQTILYRYMLCAAGGAYSPQGRFQPGQVTMVYWNPLYPQKPERLAYTEAQFRLDEEYLQRQVAQIHSTPPERFLATPDRAVCARCEFQPLCHGTRVGALEAEEEWLQDEPLAWDRLPDLP